MFNLNNSQKKFEKLNRSMVQEEPPIVTKLSESLHIMLLSTLKRKMRRAKVKREIKRRFNRLMMLTEIILKMKNLKLQKLQK